MTSLAHRTFQLQPGRWRAACSCRRHCTKVTSFCSPFPGLGDRAGAVCPHQNDWRTRCGDGATLTLLPQKRVVSWEPYSWMEFIGAARAPTRSHLRCAFIPCGCPPLVVSQSQQWFTERMYFRHACRGRPLGHAAPDPLAHTATFRQGIVEF